MFYAITPLWLAFIIIWRNIGICCLKCILSLILQSGLLHTAAASMSCYMRSRVQWLGSACVYQKAHAAETVISHCKVLMRFCKPLLPYCSHTWLAHVAKFHHTIPAKCSWTDLRACFWEWCRSGDVPAAFRSSCKHFSSGCWVLSFHPHH